MAKFRYILTYNGISLQMDSPSSPQGWEDLELTLKRDEALHGVFFEFSETTLTFIGPAFEFIKNAFDTDRINAIVSLKIDYSPYDDGNFTTIIDSVLNFSEYLEEDNAVSTNIEQNDNIIKLRNRAEHEFNLIGDESIGGVDLSSGNAGLEWDLELVSRGLFKVGQSDIFLRAGLNTANVTGTPPFKFNVKNEFEEIDAIDTLFGVITADTQINGDFEIELDVQGTGTNQYRLAWQKNGIDRAVLIDKPAGPDADFGFTGKISFSLLPGDTFNFQQSSTTGGEMTKGLFTLKFDFKVDRKTVKVITLGEGFRNATQRLLDNEVVFKSDMLGFPNGVRDADGYFPDEVYESGINPDLIRFYKFLITNGFYLRSFPETTEKEPANEDAKPFNVQFNKMFDSANAILPLGAGFDADGAFRVDQREYFYNSAISYDLGQVDKLSISPDLDNTYSLFRFGYKKFENNEDSENALLGYHGKGEWNAPIERFDNKFISISEFIADAFSIELTRREEYNSQSTKGWRYDRDVFIIHAYRTDELTNNWVNFRGDHPFFPTMVSSSDVESVDTTYNDVISPQRNARRFQKWTFGALRPFYDAQTANFISGEPNTRPSYQLTDDMPVLAESAQIRESDDLDIDAIETVFNGLLYDIEKVIELDEWIALRANARNLISLQYPNAITGILETYQGYIKELRYKPEESLIRLKLIGA